jgi:hypothetical protein
MSIIPNFSSLPLHLVASGLRTIQFLFYYIVKKSGPDPVFLLHKVPTPPPPPPVTQSKCMYGYMGSVGLSLCIVYIFPTRWLIYYFEKGGQQKGALRSCTEKSNFSIHFWP